VQTLADERSVTAVRLRAPAKINLALHVIGRRQDGYHCLQSLVVFCDPGDSLAAEPATADAFAISGPLAGAVPSGPDNLVLKARDALRGVLGRARARAVRLSLEKHLPVAAGIGGGSSDAAAALKALARLWRADSAILPGLARGLGADVPMCLVARPLMAGGIGEKLACLPAFPALHLVLVNPATPLATPAVFRALDHTDGAPLPPLPGRLDFAALTGWLARTRNDLQPPAIGLVPEIGRVLAALSASGAAIARMSGSGATCFGLYPTAEEARAAAQRIAAASPAWLVQPARSHASDEDAHEPD
jgi:4-diphosphocytidyl-2-C-methyl-D-erythritol kinase